MPLRVTIELIPHGAESHKYKIAVVDIVNDGTGTKEVGNYDVRANGHCVGDGWDTFFQGKVRGVKRGEYFDQAIDCLRVLHTSNALAGKKPRKKVLNEDCWVYGGKEGKNIEPPRAYHITDDKERTIAPVGEKEGK